MLSQMHSPKDLFREIRKSVLFMVLGLSLFGCKQIIFAVYGVSKPKEKKEIRIQKKFEKYDLKGDYSLAISDTGFIRYFNSGFSANQVLLYSKDGKFLSKIDSEKCPSSTIGFLEVFKDTNFTKPLDLDTSNYFNAYFLNLDGSKPILNLKNKYVAVVFWGTFSGRLNQQSSEWANYLIKDPEIDVICVSLDPREFWATPITKYN